MSGRYITFESGEKYFDERNYTVVYLKEVLKKGETGTYWIAETDAGEFIIVDEYYLTEMDDVH